MHRPWSRASCGFFTAACLASYLVATPAHAQQAVPVQPVTIDSTDGDDEVFARTDQVTMVPVRTRYAVHMERSFVYAPVCHHTPCETSLAEGTYHLALARPGGDLVEVPEPVVITGATTIHGTYSDRSLWRALGIVTAVVAPTGGVALLFVGSTTNGNGRSQLDPNWVAVGAGVMLAGTIAACAMVLQRDDARFTIAPLAVGAMPGARESGTATVMPTGLQATLRF